MGRSNRVKKNVECFFFRGKKNMADAIFDEANQGGA